jgi:hypothetical protein
MFGSLSVLSVLGKGFLLELLRGKQPEPGRLARLRARL